MNELNELLFSYLIYQKVEFLFADDILFVFYDPILVEAKTM